MLSKISLNLRRGLKPSLTSTLLSRVSPPPIIEQLACMSFATSKRSYGNLKDQDRIFTNLYKDDDPFIDGALRRVIIDIFNNNVGRLASYEGYSSEWD